MLDFLRKKNLLTAVFGFGDFSHRFGWNKRDSLSYYEKSLYVNKAISVRANKIAQINFQLKDTKGNLIEQGEALKWLELLDRPNEYQTGDQFWNLAQKYYDIVGAAFILKKTNTIFNKYPEELELLRADLVEVILSKDHNQILGFKYEQPGGTNITYTPDEIIYLYRPDPRNPLLGESLIASGIRTIDTEVQISEYQSNIIKNGGKPEMIFGVDGINNQAELDRLEESYVQNRAEKVRKGVPMFASGKLSILMAGKTPQELGYLDTKVSTLNDISIMTGVPKVLMGVGSKETFSNADAEIRTFLSDTIKPLADNFINVLNWRLIPDEYDLSYEDIVPAEKEEKRKDLETADKVHALTINEKRELLGFNPVKGGDDILVPFNLTSINAKEVEQVKKKSFHPLRDKNIRKDYGDKKDKLMTKFETLMLGETINYFNGQQERLLNNLGATNKRKDLLSGIFNNNLEISLAKASLLPVIRQIFMENGEDTAKTFGTDFKFNSAVERSLTERAKLLSESIISTTAEQLTLQFQQSSEAGESRAQLVNRIQNLYGDISKGRAEVIARTETHAAMVNSNLEVYRQAGLTTKIWVAVMDNRTRESHAEIDGEEAPIDAVFSNGLFSPADEINCRCQI